MDATEGARDAANAANATATAQPAAPVTRAVALRRAPKFRAFLWLGLLAGAVIGLAVGLAFSDSASLSRSQATGWVLLVSIPVCLALSLGIYVVSDWRSRRRATGAKVEVVVELPPSGVGR